MRAGELRHPVELRSPGPRVPDGGGGYTTGDPVVIAAGVWAAVEPLSAYERMRAGAVEAGITHRVRMRYRPDVSAAAEVLHAGRVLQIQGPPIDVDERHRELILLCREVV